jgi:hypothetical protein
LGIPFGVLGEICSRDALHKVRSMKLSAATWDGARMSMLKESVKVMAQLRCNTRGRMQK